MGEVERGGTPHMVQTLKAKPKITQGLPGFLLYKTQSISGLRKKVLKDSIQWMILANDLYRVSSTVIRICRGVGQGFEKLIPHF